jgi:hypothetical protein
MQPAAANMDTRVVLGETQVAVPGDVVPLRLAGDDRVAGQVALGVVVLMALLRLPAVDTPRTGADPFG